MEADFTVSVVSTAEVDFTQAGGTTLTAARASTATIMSADILAGMAHTMVGTAPIGVIRITDTVGDLVLVLALVGPIGQAMHIRTLMAPGGGEHHIITLTMLLLTRTLTMEATIPAHQILVQNPTTTLGLVRELPMGTLQAATP